MKPERIIWHHSADESKLPQFEKIDAYHKTKNFPHSTLGFFVGYHYVIESDGTLKKARREDEIGAHDKDENYNSIGICLAGNFNIGLPSEAQTKTFTKLLGEIMGRWSIPITKIETHHWDDLTDCPGKNLPENWALLEYLKSQKDLFSRTFLLIGTIKKWL